MNYLLHHNHELVKKLIEIQNNVPPASVLNNTSQKNQHEPVVTGIKGLNIISRYANHLEPSVREQVQNWRDQCVTLAMEYQQCSYFSWDSVKVIILKHGSATCFVLYCTRSNVVLGFIISIEDGNRFHVEFCNYATILNSNILQLGRTSKESQSQLAGNFGEGMKVEINRLLSCGADITFYTGKSIWNFMFVNEELCVKYSLNQQQTKDTHIVMKNLPISAKINVQDYIFFQETYCCLNINNVEIVSYSFCFIF